MIGSQQPEPRLLATAYHEAGHAVITALTLGALFIV